MYKFSQSSDKVLSGVLINNLSSIKIGSEIFTLRLKAVISANLDSGLLKGKGRSLGTRYQSDLLKPKVRASLYWSKGKISNCNIKKRTVHNIKVHCQTEMVRRN